MGSPEGPKDVKHLTCTNKQINCNSNRARCHLFTFDHRLIRNNNRIDCPKTTRNNSQARHRQESHMWPKVIFEHLKISYCHILVKLSHSDGLWDTVLPLCEVSIYNISESQTIWDEFLSQRPNKTTNSCQDKISKNIHYWNYSKCLLMYTNNFSPWQW